MSARRGSSSSLISTCNASRSSAVRAIGYGCHGPLRKGNALHTERFLFRSTTAATCANDRGAPSWGHRQTALERRAQCGASAVSFGGVRMGGSAREPCLTSRAKGARGQTTPHVELPARSAGCLERGSSGAREARWSNPRGSRRMCDRPWSCRKRALADSQGGDSIKGESRRFGRGARSFGKRANPSVLSHSGTCRPELEQGRPRKARIRAGRAVRAAPNEAGEAPVVLGAKSSQGART